MSIISDQNGKICRIASDKNSTVHFIGIGGISMYSLALLTGKMGAVVSGSDREASERTDRLSSLGIIVRIGNDPSLAKAASLVVYSNAIPETDPELCAARERDIPTVTRAEYLGAVMENYACRIGVSGTHGKSTTVAMLEAILSAAGERPTVLSGAALSNTPSPYLDGDTDMLLYEACEYKNSYHAFRPTVAVGLNLELDHTDFFRDISELKRSFTKALSLASGVAIVNSDDGNLEEIIPKIATRVATYGTKADANYRYSITSFDDNGFDFTVSKNGLTLGKFKLHLRGTFNVSNAVAAIVTAAELGIDTEISRRAIAAFSGIPRRLERLGEYRGSEIYYDYAHHPTAVAASINALRQSTTGKLTVVFRPHTYSRTADLWEDFCCALSLADRVILTDIYPAREMPIDGITSARLAAAVGAKAIYAPIDEVAKHITASDSTVVLMGAGDLEMIKNALIPRAEGNNE